jgi:hypothetical protein
MCSYVCVFLRIFNVESTYFLLYRYKNRRDLYEVSSKVNYKKLLSYSYTLERSNSQISFYRFQIITNSFAVVFYESLW